MSEGKSDKKRTRAEMEAEMEDIRAEFELEDQMNDFYTNEIQREVAKLTPKLNFLQQHILNDIVELNPSLSSGHLYRLLFSISDKVNSGQFLNPIVHAAGLSKSYLSNRNYDRVEAIINKYLLPYINWEKDFLKDSHAMGITVSRGVIIKENGKRVNKKLIDVYAEYLEDTSSEEEESEQESTSGGFFFSKKKTRKRSKKKTKSSKKKKRKSRKKKNKTRKKKEVKKKDRKFTDTSYPYRMISKKEAIDDFLSLREMVNKKDFNSKSVLGNRAVDYGTEKARKKTKYRNKSHYERWQDKVARDKVLKFAKRLYNQKYKRSVDSSIRGAIELQWGSINTMRPAAAACAYKKNKATKVLDFTAGWGARLIAAMALDIDYIGIDANKALKPGYEKIIKTLKPYSKSKVKMIFKKAETVDISKLKYDYVFTSPPYEYLEVYENMENYEKKGEKVSQPYSSSKIKIDDSEKFYDEFMIPTLKKIYKHLPKGKYICLNMPDIMYTKIKKKWKKMDKKDVYSIVGRVGGPEDFKRMEKEQIFCWKKH
tara:strand:+ start:35 stop:1654 length:1620 start_codon:yes stop_codon:yes gene_type:complete